MIFTKPQSLEQIEELRSLDLHIQKIREEIIYYIFENKVVKLILSNSWGFFVFSPLGVDFGKWVWFGLMGW